MPEPPGSESQPHELHEGADEPHLHEESDVYDFLQPTNEFEKILMQTRKRISQAYERFIGKPQQEELAPEERKLRELARVIRTYREVDEDPIEEDTSKVKWVDRPEVDMLMGFVIVLNSVAIGLEVDLGDPDDRPVSFIVFEAIFLVIFLAEVSAKIYVHGWKWPLMGFWNLFTAFVCVTAFVDGVILQALQLHGKLRMIALIRCISILRILRVIRSLKGMKELKLILQGLTGSMATLFWSVIMLVVFLYVGAVFATSAIGQSSDYTDFLKISGGFEVDTYFGTVGRSMYTLLQCTTRDSWMSQIGRYVVVQQWYMSFFLLGFIGVATYTLLNLVVSVIIEQTLTAARSNEKRLALRQAKARRAEFEGLQEIFLLIDVDGSGMLDIDEFSAALEMNDIRQRMNSLEIPVEDAQGLFATVGDEGNRALSMSEFIDGCTKLKGPAKSRDLLAISSQAEMLMKKLDTVGERLHDMEKMMGLLDEISLRITQRFAPSVVNSQHRIAKANQGLAPVKQLPLEKASSIGVSLSRGNRPTLPELPKLLS